MLEEEHLPATYLPLLLPSLMFAIFL